MTRACENVSVPYRAMSLKTRGLQAKCKSYQKERLRQVEGER